MTQLQMNILNRVCRTKAADYNSLTEGTKRNRVTILQSIQSLIKRRLINEERQNPHHSKSKRIFKPTDRGVFYSISEDHSTMHKIDKAHSLPTILQVYKDFLKIRVGVVWKSRTEEDWIRIFSDAMYRYDMFDNNGKCILSDETDLWKFFIRLEVLEQLQDKYSNIENIFYQGGIWMNLAQKIGPIGGKTMIDILKKIRNDLDYFIEIFTS